MAQLVEHLLAKEKVASSNLVFRSIFLPFFRLTSPALTIPLYPLLRPEIPGFNLLSRNVIKKCEIINSFGVRHLTEFLGLLTYIVYVSNYSKPARYIGKFTRLSLLNLTNAQFDRILNLQSCFERKS